MRVADNHRPAVLLMLQTHHSRLVQVKGKPVWHCQLVFGIGHGNVFLGIPVAQVVVEIAFHPVLIFYHASNSHLWNTELYQFRRFVQLLFVNHRAFHLRLHHLAILQIIGGSLQTSYNLVFGRVVAGTDGNRLVAHILTFRLEYLEATLHTIKDTEVVDDPVVVHADHPAQFYSIGILIADILCHLQFLVRWLSPFQVGL